MLNKAGLFNYTVTARAENKMKNERRSMLDLSPNIFGHRKSLYKNLAGRDQTSPMLDLKKKRFQSSIDSVQKGSDEQFNEELRKMRAGILEHKLDIQHVRLEN